MKRTVNVIGAGLAGCEAAWQAAELGCRVNLYEMKPKKKTPAHTSDTYAELVCSNSLRSDQLSNAVGLLKEEMHRLGSLVMEAAYASRVAAGAALAVDREGFSRYITEKINTHKNITVINEEITEIQRRDMYRCNGPSYLGQNGRAYSRDVRRRSSLFRCGGTYRGIFKH